MDQQLFEAPIKGAIISDCGQYRYSLWRIWDEDKPRVLFIMLNPSTADESKDDPTIRRCIGFAKSWGYGGFYVGNLFAYRSSSPKDLLSATHPKGLHNYAHLVDMESKCEKVVFAWGNGPILKKLKIELPTETVGKAPAYCIALSKDGTPKHPLYLPKVLVPRLFNSIQ